MLISMESAQSIVNEMKSTIHHDINIMDQDGRIIASTNRSRIGQLHQGVLELLKRQLPLLVIYEDDLSRNVQAGINLPIAIDGVTEGVIGVTGDPKEVSVFGEIIKRMTEIMIGNARTQEQVDLLERATGSFIENWLFSEEPDWDALSVRGRLLGLDIKLPYVVALIEFSEKQEKNGSDVRTLSEVQKNLMIRMIRRRLNPLKKHYCAVVRNQILVLLAESSRRAAEEMLFQIQKDIEGHASLQVHGGASISGGQPADLRRCYEEAQIANITAQRQDAAHILFYDEASLDFIVTSIPNKIRKELKGRILESCSGQEHEDIVELVRIYFLENGDLQACADRLFVHRNTVQYRIDRIEKKTGYNLRYPKDACLLYLAIS